MDVGDLQDINRIITPNRIPVVLSQNGVARVLSHMSGTYWIMAMLFYDGGLRREECMTLRVKDIDFDYLYIRIIGGAKGATNRNKVYPGVYPERFSGFPGNNRLTLSH